MGPAVLGAVAALVGSSVGPVSPVLRFRLILEKNGARVFLRRSDHEKDYESRKSAWTEEMFESCPDLGLGFVSAGIADSQGDVWLATDTALHRFRKPTLVPFVERPMNAYEPDFGAGRDGTI